MSCIAANQCIIKTIHLKHSYYSQPYFLNVYLTTVINLITIIISALLFFI